MEYYKYLNKLQKYGTIWGKGTIYWERKWARGIFVITKKSEKRRKTVDNVADYVNHEKRAESANHITMRFSLIFYFVLLGEIFQQYIFMDSTVWEYIFFWSVAAVILLQVFTFFIFLWCFYFLSFCQCSSISGSRLGRPARIGKSVFGRLRVELKSCDMFKNSCIYLFFVYG